MIFEELRSCIEEIDPYCCAIYLEVEASQVVELQAYFEHFEGLGLVRTIDVPKSQVCILTTTCQVDACIEALGAIRFRLNWRGAEGLFGKSGVS